MVGTEAVHQYLTSSVMIIFCILEMCMGMGFPMGPGIPWEWE